MGRTEMSKGELRRVEVLARVRSKHLRIVDASKLLQVSYRQAKRLWKRYREEGAAGLNMAVWAGPRGSMTDLGTLGGTFSDGLGINASGQVTGYSFSNNGEVAFLYTPSAGMVDLNTLIPSGSGWTLLAAYGINDAGQITGYGTIPNGNGAAEPFLLVPVVPFSAFTADLEISGNPLSSFEINGSFTLGAGSHGIDPVNEPVTLALDTFSITIPKKSFTRTSTGAFQYEGSVQGVPLEFRIIPVTNGFTFTAEGNRATGLPATKLVTVTLTIGDDMGTKTVRRGS